MRKFTHYSQQYYLCELPKLIDMSLQKGQRRGGVGVKPGKEEETDKLSDSRDDERVLVLRRLANPVRKRGEILVEVEKP